MIIHDHPWSFDVFLCWRICYQHHPANPLVPFHSPRSARTNLWAFLQGIRGRALSVAAKSPVLLFIQGDLSATLRTMGLCITMRTGQNVQLATTPDFGDVVCSKPAMFWCIYVYLCVSMCIYVYLCVSMCIYVYLCVSAIIQFGPVPIWTSKFMNGGPTVTRKKDAAAWWLGPQICGLAMDTISYSPKLDVGASNPMLIASKCFTTLFLTLYLWFFGARNIYEYSYLSNYLLVYKRLPVDGRCHMSMRS